MSDNKLFNINNARYSAFTMIEAVIIIFIIGVVSAIAIPNLLSQIKYFKLKENTVTVEQAINEARSIAIKKSTTVSIDFASAKISHNPYGGLLQIKKNDGTVLSDIYLDSSIMYNGTLSTIPNDKVIFNYHGQPVDEYGSAPGFNQSNNRVSVSYYKATSALISKSIIINPYTGKTELQ